MDREKDKTEDKKDEDEPCKDEVDEEEDNNNKVLIVYQAQYTACDYTVRRMNLVELNKLFLCCHVVYIKIIIMITESHKIYIKFKLFFF